MYVLDAVRKEVEWREAGGPADRRFDLALDVLADLEDELASPNPAEKLDARPALARTLVSNDGALD